MKNLLSKETVNTITSIEIAEMLEMKHHKILRKLEGDKTHMGIMDMLESLENSSIDEYFVKSSYNDASGKSNKMYIVSKKGLSAIINSFSNTINKYRLISKYNELFGEEYEVILYKRHEIEFF